MNYTSSNSGDGRYQFTNQTTDYAVSDIGYVGNTDTTPPSFPFIFVPITAGGIAFMYNIPGLAQTLQLSSYTACAVLTGGITNWNNSNIAQDNPGVTLPNLPIKPVSESDSAGTNYVLEEWCIDEQPAVWTAFANSQNSQQGGPTDGVTISASAPNSNWPGVQGGLDDQNTTSVASDIATNPGAIGAVQLQYATDLGFTGSDPSKAVASVKNASGDYAQPTPVDVSSALAYATQQANGTHVLNFNGQGPHVYNPSTYSYLLTPTTGWATSKGATMSAFVNYALTLGQQEAPKFGYASLGLSLEQYGVNAVTLDVPGAVAVTTAEKTAYACGDLTPTEVAAGQTTPTCGVTNTAAPPPPPNAGNGGTGSNTAGGTSSTSTGTGTGANASSHGATVSASARGGVGAHGSLSSVDPGVSLSGSPTMAFTGGNPVPLTALGLFLLGLGFFGRRRVLRGRTTGSGR
jgi:ABC-type phosphate transport system substrate-binding protein